MKRLLIKAMYIATLGVFLTSCEKETVEPLEPPVENYISGKTLQNFIEAYSLDGITSIKLDETLYKVNAITEAESDEIKTAFETYSVIAYLDDQALAQLYSKRPSDKELENLGKPDFSNANSEASPKAASEKVWYNIRFYEHKDYGGTMIQKSGNKWISKNITKNISVSNVWTFNDKASSYKLHVEPYKPSHCNVRARLHLFQHDNFNAVMHSVGGETEYGGRDYTSIWITHKNFKDDDELEAKWWYGWYTYYKTHSYNDKMTSYSLQISRLN